MDATELGTLSDEQLILLKAGAEGLPFGHDIDALLAARRAARQAAEEERHEQARTLARDIADGILHGGPDADVEWFGIDELIESEEERYRLVARLTVELLDAEHYAPAAATIGRMYLKAAAGYPSAPDKAFAAFQRGARYGDPIAIYWLGHCLERGIGCEPNVLRALAWYETIPECPHLELKVARARLYQRGLGGKALRADLPDLHRFILAYHAQFLADDAPEDRVTRRRGRPRPRPPTSNSTGTASCSTARLTADLAM